MDRARIVCLSGVKTTFVEAMRSSSVLICVRYSVMVSKAVYLTV